MDTLGIDIETFSSVDLAKSGVYAYVDSPDFQILLIAYKLSDNVEIIDISGMSLSEAVEHIRFFYPEFWDAFLNHSIIKTAFNANFERTCLAKYFNISCPPEEWSCTAVLAATLGLPRSLADVGAALGLSQDKQKDKIGKSLIEYFCKPCKATKTNKGRTRNLPEHDMEKWELFKGYCKQDVVAEQAIYERLKIYTIIPEERKLWCLDQRANDRGIRLDTDFIENIIAYDEINTERLVNEAINITGLANPNSLTQLKQWFSDSYGLELSSITKTNIPEIMESLKAFGTEGEAGIRVLEIRQALGKTSVKKYQAMTTSVCSDDRLRGILQFYGANRTGRWAGKIVQVHNLPQNKIPDIDLARQLVKEDEFELLELLFGNPAFVFSQLIRTAFIASEGCRFVVSDFAAIEARVLAWLANETWRLEVFINGGDIYCASASQMFHVPVEKHGVNGHLRQKGKVAELALGYGGGFGAIKSMDTSGSIPDEEIPSIISQWRYASPNICKMWRTVEAAAKAAIKEHRTVGLDHGLQFSYVNGILFIKLPSGRKIAYYDARLEMNAKNVESITYAGTEQDSKKWGRLETWGGKLVENIVQAVARDCLAVAMTRIEQAGYNIVMHVHDEVIADVPAEDKNALDKINEIMAAPIDWAPGLPLKGDGYETPYYKKD